MRLRTSSRVGANVTASRPWLRSACQALKTTSTVLVGSPMWTRRRSTKNAAQTAAHSLSHISHIIFGRETLAEGRQIASAASRNGVMAGPAKH